MKRPLSFLFILIGSIFLLGIAQPVYAGDVQADISSVQTETPATSEIKDEQVTTSTTGDSSVPDKSEVPITLPEEIPQSEEQAKSSEPPREPSPVVVESQTSATVKTTADILPTDTVQLAAEATASNQILNPSVEQADSSDPTKPANWFVGTWGQNTSSATYVNNGQDGVKGLYISMAQHTDGDAKWYPADVSVVPQETYKFADYYKSTASTEVVLRYTVGAGTYEYVFLGMLPATSVWTLSEFDFTVPANATHVTVFHLIAQVGELWTDNYSLVKTTVTPPQDPPTPPSQDGNLIPNPSVENATGNTPTNWHSNNWGTNTAQFDHATPGSTGAKNVHVKITSYTDGDAKWYHDDVPVSSGESYKFSDMSKATVPTEIVVRYTVGANQFTYVFLGTVPANAEWTHSEFDFTVPANATHATIFHLLAAVGDLWVDDFSLVKTVVTPPPPPPPAGQNQIANPSVEDVGVNNLPVGWSSNNWGSNNAVFEYANGGQSGGKSLKVTVTNYVDGDAKWYHSPVTASHDGTYNFSNYYKGNSASETVIQFEMEDGTFMYHWLGSNPASSTWRKSDYTFIVPHGVAKLTIFHVLAANGELWTDNFSLIEVLPGIVTTVPNGNLETESGELPVSWSNNSWGNNTSVFEYLKNFGHNNSSHSVKVTVTNYVDGDAKWLHADVPLTPGGNYKVIDFYQSNTDSRVVLAVTMGDGSIQYLELPGAPASATWARYEGTFTMPTGAVAVSIYHLLSHVGFLITDSYDIVAYNPVPFTRGLVTLTFDDGWEDNIDTAIVMMGQYGYKSNQFYATTFIENAPMGEANAQAVIQQIEAAGHEIGSHSINHPDLTTLTSAQVQQELVQSQAYLQSFLNGNINYFATPYGAYNQAVKNQIMTVYDLHRTVDTGFNSKDNFDITRLKVQNVLSTTTAAEVSTWLEQAKADNTWLILLYHRVADNPETYDTTPELFGEQLAVINASGVPVVTISQALAELTPQLA